MCTYRCISPECFDEIYARDEVPHIACIFRMTLTRPALQIEEGEVDAERGRLFGACFRRMHKKEQDEIIRQQREERLAKRREGQVA